MMKPLEFERISVEEAAKTIDRNVRPGNVKDWDGDRRPTPAEPLTEAAAAWLASLSARRASAGARAPVSADREQAVRTVEAAHAVRRLHQEIDDERSRHAQGFSERGGQGDFGPGDPLRIGPSLSTFDLGRRPEKVTRRTARGTARSCPGSCRLA